MVAIDTHIGYIDKIYPYRLFLDIILVISIIEDINSNIIQILPISSRLNVKKSRHHSIFSTAFMINQTIISLSIVDLVAHIDSIIANARYIMLHIIGIRISGTHEDGLSNVAYQSIPRFTNILPNTATTKIEDTIKMIFLILISVFILLYYV